MSKPNSIVSAFFLLLTSVFLVDCRTRDSLQPPNPIELRGIWLASSDDVVFSNRESIDSQIKINNPNRFMFPGIFLSHGGQSVSVEYLKEALRYNRYNGYNGEVISSYEDLRNENRKLAVALLESSYKTPARLPSNATFQK